MLLSLVPDAVSLTLLVVIGLVLACIIIAKINSSGSADGLLVAEPSTKANPKDLIVLVHAFQRNMENMEPIKSIAESVRPDAEVIRFEFPAQLFSNASLFSLADQLEKKIDTLESEKNYERIILAGHSIGALLVRKAYVYGCGRIEDAPGSDGKTLPTRDAKPWASKVERFVLMAGMNRGWSKKSKQLQNSLVTRTLQWVGFSLAKLSGTGKLALQTEQGEPFVANLRIQWLDVMNAKPKSQRPTVIQMLGKEDDVVDGDDSKDVKVSKDFIWVPVPATTHASIVDVGDTPAGRLRRELISEAFGDAASVERLRVDSQQLDVNEDPAVESVVFVLHGIRDMAKWTTDYKEPLEAAYLAEHPDGKTKLHVHLAQYGYFGMGPFLLWADRQKNVRWFMDQITELKAKFPNLKEISLIGHSNGTYILASALRKYASLKIHRSALAGSVIRRDFPWSQYAKRINAVRNYVGSEDWVVGLCPCVFEKPLFNVFNEDIGSAGFNGFTDPMAVPLQTKFVRGAHGAALHKDNIDSIVKFIIRGDLVDAPTLKEDDHPVWLGFIPLSLLSQVCWLLWILVLCLLLWGAVYSPVFLSWCIQHAPSGFHLEQPMINWLSRGLYVGLLWLILSTI